MNDSLLSMPVTSPQWAAVLASVDTLALIGAKLVATGRRNARPGAGKAAREAQLCPPGLPEALCEQPLVRGSHGAPHNTHPLSNNNNEPFRGPPGHDVI